MSELEQQLEIRHTASAAIKSRSVSSDVSGQRIGSKPEDETLAAVFRSQDVTGTADVRRSCRSARADASGSESERICMSRQVGLDTYPDLPNVLFIIEHRGLLTPGDRSDRMVAGTQIPKNAAGHSP